MEDILSKAVEIGLKYSNSLGQESPCLKDLGKDLQELKEIKESLKDIDSLDIVSAVQKSLEKELGLSQLFESTKKALPEILQDIDLDRNYLDCIKSNDTERLEKILKFAAEKNDHKHTVYRGDDKPYNDYTESLRRCWEDKSCGGALGRGLYFASTERYADIFGAKARFKGVTRQFFIKANFVDLDAEGVGDFIMEYQAPYMDKVKKLDEAAEPYRKGRKPDEPKHPSVLAYDVHVDKLQNQVFKAIKEKFNGDSVCVKEYGLFARDGEYEYNIQNPKHVKLADLIVRDDNGDIIPPSKRFDTKSSDIRGMTKEALLRLPLNDGLKYLAKGCYREEITISKWKENLFTAVADLTRESPKIEVVKDKTSKPTKKSQEDLVPVM
jgi:hypothetical protein